MASVLMISTRSTPASAASNPFGSSKSAWTHLYATRGQIRQLFWLARTGHNLARALLQQQLHNSPAKVSGCARYKQGHTHGCKYNLNAMKWMVSANRSARGRIENHRAFATTSKLSFSSTVRVSASGFATRYMSPCKRSFSTVSFT